MDTNTGSASNQTGGKSFTRFFPHIARVLMGLAFLFFGVMGLFQLMKAPDNLPEDIKKINAALTMAGYMKVASVTMVLVGLLLLINRFVPLALALIAPILAGILTYHIATSPSMIGPGAFLSLLELYLAWSYRKAFCPMLAAKVSPGGNCG
jgi:Na+/H+ antiporter NhaD/arsenite permease-like protein